MTEQQLSFQAEVGRILDIVANSLYSEREVFLRELISNASDACDRLRYLAITAPDLTADDPVFKITLSVDEKSKTLAIADNGIGMNRQDLIDNLGTIARSGSSAFVAELSGDAAKDVDLIGRFGVGFYSVYMVADKVDVISRKAGEDAAWRWSSDGRGEFTVAEAERAGRGTSITLHLRKDAKEFLDADRLRRVVKTHSDHIGLPIVLAKADGEEEALNEASALWTKPRKEITDEQYTEFYRHVSHQFDEPWLVIHNRAEGRIEYTNLLFVPSTKPFDLFEPERHHRVKLYVKKVFITEECDGLVPPYLRFLRGLVDSQDLPLNISREMLQKNPMVAKIRAALVKRVLGELEKKAEKAPDDYARFWDNFGAVLKEGIYEDREQRDRLLKLARFRSTAADGKLVALSDYVGRMREGQEAIYYIIGEVAESLAKSPQLEGFRARAVEVLLFADPVDAFWVGAVNEFDGKPFRPANRGQADLDSIPAPDAGEGEEPDALEGAELGTLVAALKQNLGDAVADVRASSRLTDSAVCLVGDEGALDPHLERLLRQHQRLDHASPRILEINPRHVLIKQLAVRAAAAGGADALADLSQLLLDQARILDGEPVADPVAFARRLSDVMARGIPN